MPAAGAGYTGGAEFAAAGYRANLHYVDAWLNPNRLSRGPVATSSPRSGGCPTARSRRC
jgi:hypothetical protein